MANISIDVSNFPNWGNLQDGNHNITVRAKASHYYGESSASGVVVVNKAAPAFTVVISYYRGSHFGPDAVYDGTSSSDTKLVDLDSSWGEHTYTVQCTSGYLFFEGDSLTEMEDIATTGSISLASTTADGWTFVVASNGTIEYVTKCLIEGTKITLADGSTKNIEDITFDDELLVWNFYEGKLDKAKPMWIKNEQIAYRYNLVTFDNGVEIGFVGPGKNIGYHRVFNVDKQFFTHTGNHNETPNGTVCYAQDGSMPSIVKQEIIDKEVKYYNVITDTHYNLFANGILTSSKISNKYRINDMRYDLERQIISDKDEKDYIEKLKEKGELR